MRPVTGSLCSPSNFSIAALVAWSRVPETLIWPYPNSESARCTARTRDGEPIDAPMSSAIGSLRRTAGACGRGAAGGCTAAVASAGRGGAGAGAVVAACRAGIGHLRPCRIGEKWRRMRARLQEDRIDDDHEAGSTSAEDRQRVDRTVRNFRPKAKADRSGGADGASCGPAPVFVAAVTHFSLPVCRHSTRDPRPPTRRLQAGRPRPSASGPANGQPLRWRSTRKASCPASPARNRGACAR